MVFTNVLNPRSFIIRKEEYKKTLLKKGCSIGANATIVCGLTVGEYALIGAGTVVTRDIKPFEMVYGVPAKHQGWVSIAGNKLNFNENNIAEDSFDNSKYKLIIQFNLSHNMKIPLLTYNRSINLIKKKLTCYTCNS